MNHPRATNRRAFTLIEMVAAMVVVGVIGAVGSMTLQRAAAANSRVAMRGDLYAEASAIMDRVVRIIQSSPSRTGSSPAVPSIATFSASSITWDGGSAITYTPATQTIMLRDIAAGDAAASSPVLATNVSSFVLAPLDSSNVNLLTSLGVTSMNSTQSAGVRRVSVSLTITRLGQTVTLRSRAYLRCTMMKAAAQ